jgi:hypothetical protein|tara:strand:+ start:365 stop:595 length:231 start_codon:yes stop_codon:yes gene_type:complete
MRKIDLSYDDGILNKEDEYLVGVNDGQTFTNVKYKGVRLFNGKKMLMFETKSNKQLTINPSFHTFTLEQKTNKDKE